MLIEDVFFHAILFLVVEVKLSTICKIFLDSLIVRWNIIRRIIVMFQGKGIEGLIIRGLERIPLLLIITSFFLHCLQLCHRILGSLMWNCHDLDRDLLLTLFLGDSGDFWFAKLWTPYVRFLHQLVICPRLVCMAVILILFAAFFITFLAPYSLHLFFCLKSQFQKTLRHHRFLILLSLL